MRTTLIILAITYSLHAQAQDWQLFGRHGECTPIAMLKGKLPDLPAINTPEALAAYLDARGIKYTQKRHDDGRNQAVEFQVAEHDLALMLVPKASCKTFLAR